MDCVASDRCRKAGSNACNDYCYGKLILAYQIEAAKIPLLYRRFKYYDLSIPSKVKQIVSKYCQNIANNVESGYSLYFYGDNGTGKTATACAVLIEYLIRKAPTAKQQPQGMFVVVPDMLTKLRDNLGEDEHSILFNELKHVRLLVLDDIGTERPTDWVREKLFELINYRYSNNLTTIYTSNLSTRMIETVLGRRIAYRLDQATKIYFSPDNDEF